MSTPLSDLLFFSLSIGAIPNIWKQANITPISKTNDKSDPSVYRPISLLNIIGTVLQKLVHKHVFNFFRDKEEITTLQSGFVPGVFTINQLIDIHNIFCKTLNEGKEVRAIFCAVSKNNNEVIQESVGNLSDRMWHKWLCINYRQLELSDIFLPDLLAI